VKKKLMLIIIKKCEKKIIIVAARYRLMASSSPNKPIKLADLLILLSRNCKYKSELKIKRLY
jgi:hypothetical protein